MLSFFNIGYVAIYYLSFEINANSKYLVMRALEVPLPLSEGGRSLSNELSNSIDGATVLFLGRSREVCLMFMALKTLPMSAEGRTALWRYKGEYCTECVFA